MDFSKLKIAGQWVEKHLPEILTGLAIAGVPITVYDTVKATIKTKEKIDELNLSDELTESHTDTIDKVKATYKYWIPPMVSAVVTVGCVVGANHLHLKKETALAAIGTLYKGKYEDLEKAVRKVTGDEKFEEIEHEAAKTDIKNASQKIPNAVAGKSVVYEPYSKQFIELSPKDFEWAELMLNKMVTQRRNVTYNEFLRILPNAKSFWGGDQIGWFSTGDHPWIDINPYKSSVDGRDVLYMHFTLPPDVEDKVNGPFPEYLYSK